MTFATGKRSRAKKVHCVAIDGTMIPGLPDPQGSSAYLARSEVGYCYRCPRYRAHRFMWPAQEKVRGIWFETVASARTAGEWARKIWPRLSPTVLRGSGIWPTYIFRVSRSYWIFIMLRNIYTQTATALWSEGNSQRMVASPFRAAQDWQTRKLFCSTETDCKTEDRPKASIYKMAKFLIR